MSLFRRSAYYSHTPITLHIKHQRVHTTQRIHTSQYILHMIYNTLYTSRRTKHYTYVGEFPIWSYNKVKGSTKSSDTFLLLVRRIFFYIIWKLIYIALFWAVALIFWVPPSWLKIDFKSILSHFLDLRPFYAMKGAPKNLKPRLKIKLYK